MIQFENTIEIRRPVEQVFAYVSDLENLPEWNAAILRSTHTAGEKGAPGAVYHLVRRESQRDLKIIEVEPDRRLVIETIPPARPPLRRELRFEPQGGGTKIIDHWLEMDEQPRLKEQLPEGLDKLSALTDLERLKARLEETPEAG